LKEALPLKSLSNRIEQLDSIRGLAALIVFIHHANLVTKKSLFPHWVLDSPLKVVISGHASVILFFVLSGFVLFLPFGAGKGNLYHHFIVKRIMRIYVPYLVAIGTAMLLAATIAHGPIKALSAWFNRSWDTKPTSGLFWEHITLLGNVHSSHFDNVIWSLVQEMRISLIFPLLAWLILRGRWWMMVPAMLILSATGGLNDIYHWQKSNGFHTTYFDTIHYTSMFILGAMLAKYKDRIVPALLRIPVWLRWAVPVAGFWLYVYPNVITKALGLKPAVYGQIVQDLIISAGAGAFIVFAIASVAAAKVLQLRPLTFLGKISYSLYLYHLLALVGMLHLFYGKLPIWQIYSLAFVVAMVVSTLSYYFIEKPAIRLGKYWTRGKAHIAPESSSIPRL
jgi:peptidoglycan/LPS O-acetylase OafA/YrhL